MLFALAAVIVVSGFWYDLAAVEGVTVVDERTMLLLVSLLVVRPEAPGVLLPLLVATAEAEVAMVMGFAR